MKEIFKDIPSYEGLYQVSNLGNVKSLERWRNTGTGGYIQKVRLLKLQLDQQGYQRVILYINSTPNMIHVHQLIAITFLNHKPNGFKGLVINHKNFIKKDNRVENIELTTQRENANQKHIKSSSKYTGVHRNNRNGKWCASIQIKGLDVFLYKESISLTTCQYYRIVLELDRIREHIEFLEYMELINIETIYKKVV